MKSPKILALALLCAAGATHAEDGLTLGIGADYSTGDYGSETTTDIWSVPVSARYNSGQWSWKASLPWLRVDGDASVLPGLGNVGNLNPQARTRGRGRGNEPVTLTDAGSASGIGDLRLSGTYAFDNTGDLGVDLTANAKIATADEDKGLGTGANDYGLALDLYRAVGDATVFGGVGYTLLGDSEFIDTRDVFNANVGASWQVGNGSLGAMYDWRAAASDTADDRSEITGFYSLRSGESTKWQFYATKGLSDGSPDWGAGIALSWML
jgi:hypothetical protein